MSLPTQIQGQIHFTCSPSSHSGTTTRERHDSLVNHQRSILRGIRTCLPHPWVTLYLSPFFLPFMQRQCFCASHFAMTIFQMWPSADHDSIPGDIASQIFLQLYGQRYACLSASTRMMGRWSIETEMTPLSSHRELDGGSKPNKSPVATPSGARLFVPNYARTLEPLSPVTPEAFCRLSLPRLLVSTLFHPMKLYIFLTR